jgi:hypothetical protein
VRSGNPAIIPGKLAVPRRVTSARICFCFLIPCPPCKEIFYIFPSFVAVLIAGSRSAFIPFSRFSVGANLGSAGKLQELHEGNEQDEGRYESKAGVLRKSMPWTHRFATAWRECPGAVGSEKMQRNPQSW